jgi:DNA recombination protein RmuC
MEPLFAIVVFIAGAFAGGLAVHTATRRLRESELQHAAAEAQSAARETARSTEIELRTSLERSTTECKSALRRCDDLTRDLRATRESSAQKDAELRLAHDELTRRKTEEATFATRLDEMGRAHMQLRDAFQALSADALKNNNAAFLQLARSELEKVRVAAHSDLREREVAIDALLAPIREGLEKYDTKLHDIERARSETFGALTQRLESVSRVSDSLRAETHNLVRALRSPGVRGRWGEVQLKRVCELAGMLDHCDFRTQESVDGEHGKLRPDLVVRLVGGKTIVVDAKTPLEAYLEAMNAPDDEARRSKLLQHARQVRQHVESLSKKSYWEQFEHAPDMVVLFLPGESFFSAALEHDPSLIEQAVDQRVILATPTTLIALLKALSYGWRQESLAQNAQEISTLGKELYERLSLLGGHFDAVGESLGKAVSSYNKAVGSLEGRVLVSARRFRELGAAPGEEIAVVNVVEALPRELQSGELHLPTGMGEALLS